MAKTKPPRFTPTFDERVSMLMLACSFQPRYSGAASSRVWKQINKPWNDRALYDFACALQDMETRFLGALNATMRPDIERIIRRMDKPKKKRR